MAGARPWNKWFHCMGNTYGTWLPGDERGWRSWRHREHCEGDYKNPPREGAHAELLQLSMKMMTRPPVLFDRRQREIVARAMGERLRELDAEVVELCVSKVHFHVLVRFAPVDIAMTEESRAIAMARPCKKLKLVAGNKLEDGRDPLPRHVIGLAKKHASFVLRENGYGRDGGIWAKKSKIVPIESRAHQLHVAKYIRDHVEEGGAALSLIAPELVVRNRK
jgi:hypothetical protein